MKGIKASNKYDRYDTEMDERIGIAYNITFEEEMEEQRKMELAISHLESFGVEVRIKYGAYRNIYNVLKDLGECLDKKQKNLKGE